jgi:hypothetical protein
VGSGPSQVAVKYRESFMHSVFYIIGVIVVVLAIIGFVF